MARAFNVAVDIFLVDRISRDVMRIGRSFGSAEQRVRTLQRALNDLQMRQGLHIQQARAMQSIARDSDAGLARRIATMQAALNIRRAEVAESHKLERASISRLDPLAQAIALRKQESKEAEDAIELERKQSAISDLQARRSRMHELSAIRNAKLQNAILRDRTRIKERNLEVSEAERAVRRQRWLHFGVGAAVVGTAIAAAFVEAVKKAMPIQVSQIQAGEAGGLTPKQTKQLYPLALNIATSSKVLSLDEVMSGMPRIAATLHNYRLMQAVAPSMFRMIGYLKTFGATGSVADIVGDIAQTQRALGAHTPAQYRAVNRVIGDVYADTGGLMSPEQIAATLRTVGPAIVKQPFGKGLQFAKELTLLQGLTGVKGLPKMFQDFMLPAKPQMLAALGMMGVHGRMLHEAMTRGLSEQQVINIVRHAPRGLKFPARLMLQDSDLKTLLALQKAMSGGVMKMLQTDMAKQQSSAVLLAKALGTTAGAVTALNASIKTIFGVEGKKHLKLAHTWLGRLDNTLKAAAVKNSPLEYLLKRYGEWVFHHDIWYNERAWHYVKKSGLYVWSRAKHNVEAGIYYVGRNGIPLYMGPASRAKPLHEPLPVHLRPSSHAEKQSASAAHASSAGDTIVHHTTHVHVDGKTLATASEKYRVRSARDNLKASMNSKASGHGTLVHPAVATGNP